MKTIEEIITRNDYVRVTQRLADAVVELAEKVRTKMEALDLEDWDTFRVCRVHSRCGYTDTHLAYIREDGMCFNLETSNFGYYYFCNDYNCKVMCASNKMRLEFLNEAREILHELDEYETSKVSEIEASLANAGFAQNE